MNKEGSLDAYEQAASIKPHITIGSINTSLNQQSYFPLALINQDPTLICESQLTSGLTNFSASFTRGINEKLFSYPAFPNPQMILQEEITAYQQLSQQDNHQNIETNINPLSTSNIISLQNLPSDRKESYLSIQGMLEATNSISNINKASTTTYGSHQSQQNLIYDQNYQSLSQLQSTNHSLPNSSFSQNSLSFCYLQPNSFHPNFSNPSLSFTQFPLITSQSQLQEQVPSIQTSLNLYQVQPSQFHYYPHQEQNYKVKYQEPGNEKRSSILLYSEKQKEASSNSNLIKDFSDPSLKSTIQNITFSSQEIALKQNEDLITYLISNSKSSSPKEESKEMKVEIMPTQINETEQYQVEFKKQFEVDDGEQRKKINIEQPEIKLNHAINQANFKERILNVIQQDFSEDKGIKQIISNSNDNGESPTKKQFLNLNKFTPIELKKEEQNEQQDENKGNTHKKYLNNSLEDFQQNDYSSNNTFKNTIPFQSKERMSAFNFLLKNMTNSFNIQKRIIENLGNVQSIEQILLSNTLSEMKSFRKEVDSLIQKSTDIQGQSGLLDFMRSNMKALAIENPSILQDREQQIDPSSFFSKYELVLKEGDFSEPLVKDKNFVIGVSLQDIETKQEIINCQPIPIRLRLYTYNNPPNILENDFLKGQLTSSIIQGTCTFKKIHSKQVTSHHKNRALFLVIEGDTDLYLRSLKSKQLKKSDSDLKQKQSFPNTYLPASSSITRTTTQNEQELFQQNSMDIAYSEQSSINSFELKTKKKKKKKQTTLQEKQASKQDSQSAKEKDKRQHIEITQKINVTLIKPLILEQIVVKSKNNFVVSKQ